MLSRRNFLAISAATGTQAAFNSLETFARPLRSGKAAQGYGLLIFATHQGYAGGWEDFEWEINRHMLDTSRARYS